MDANTKGDVLGDMRLSTRLPGDVDPNWLSLLCVTCGREDRGDRFFDIVATLSEGFYTVVGDCAILPLPPWKLLLPHLLHEVRSYWNGYLISSAPQRIWAADDLAHYPARLRPFGGPPRRGGSFWLPGAGNRP